MIQYTDSYSNASSQIQNIVANDISLMDMYILMQTGQYEWTAKIYTIGSGETRQIRIYRENTSGYNSPYFVERTENVDFTSTFHNEYYVYSNMGYGNSIALPVYDGVQSWSLMIISCVLMFAIVFKGALFKCLDKKRR